MTDAVKRLINIDRRIQWGRQNSLMFQILFYQNY